MGRHRWWRAAMQLALTLLMVAATLGSAARVGAQKATPVAEGVGSEGLRGMLARVPAVLPELENPDIATVSYADIAQQLSTLGLEPPRDVEDDEAFTQWVGATRGMAMPNVAASYLIQWREAYGFDLLQVDETLEIAAPPFSLTLYRGRFDTQAVLRALYEQGYKPITIEGVAVLSVREDYEFDLQDAPIPGVLATMNYAAFLPDGTLVFAPARAIIEGVAAVANGEAASLAERIDTSTLLPHAPDELVSAVIVSGSQLAGGDPAQVVLPEGEATPDAGEIADAVGIDEGEALPPIVLALLGWTAGGPIERLSADEDEAATPLPQGVPEAQPVALLLMLTPAAAESAVPIIEERLETGTSLMTRQPYTDFFADWTITAISDEPVVVLDFTLAEAHRDILVQMLLRRDLVFLAW